MAIKRHRRGNKIHLAEYKNRRVDGKEKKWSETKIGVIVKTY